MTTQGRGAKIQAPSFTPSVDLARLVELLAEAVEVDRRSSSSRGPRQRPLFLFDTEKQRLRICTSAVLLRLFSAGNFRASFKTSDTSGFIRDFHTPAFGLQAKLGGVLTEGNQDRLPHSVDKLMAAIDQALDAALTGESDLSKLLLDNPAEQLKALASRVGAAFKDKPYQASLHSLRFDSGTQGTAHSTSAVAKVLSATEQVEAEDCFAKMSAAIATRLEQRGCDEDEITDAIDSLEAERDRADSQITRFLNFLDNEALSRVRLNVTFRIMETIAENARSSTQADHQQLVDYVDRVLALLEAVKTNGLSVDLTAHYGENAEFELLDYLNRSTFYSCLAVWPEWKTQIFEEKVRSQTSYGVQREVSYRFRINGNNPEHNKPAFESRLDLIEKVLLNEDLLGLSATKICRHLAELMVLDVVVPKRSETRQDISAAGIATALKSRLSILSSQGKPAIQDLVRDLKERASTMQAIARALVKIIQGKGDKIVAQAQRRTAQQFICVKRDIVAWNRLEGAEAGVRDLLVGSQPSSQEQVEWFNHIEISDSPDAPQLLFSLKVTTELTEHDLVLKEQDAQVIQAQRLFPGKLLQILWVPFDSQRDEEYKPLPVALEARNWALPAAVQVEYEVRTLSRQKAKQNTEDSQQYHTAAIAAFTILVYCCLWRVIKRLQAEPVNLPQGFITLMLRLQGSGKNSDSEGDTYVYAAAQSIEAILAQDTPVRMQGIVLDNLAQGKPSAQYVKSGAFNALLSAFPLTLGSKSNPAIEKVGVISYSTRPCNEMPTSDRDNKSHLFLTQSYIASAVSQPFSGYELKSERMQSDIVRSLEDMQRQRVIREEIGHLQHQGCKHIILISHAYGNRRLNRTADSNSPLTPTTFLEEVFQSFPELTIYPLLRDVFPATRLRKRKTGEAAFEILSAGDHVNFIRNTLMERVRDIIPVYTFATLHVIEEEKRPQSGFCVYFLLSDQRVSDITWTERARQHLLNPEGNSPVHPCLISVLRGLHFIEAEQGVKGGQFIPVLDPFSWISPSTKEAAGEVEILHSRRRGRFHLSYPALLTHIAQVLHRR